MLAVAAGLLAAPVSGDDELMWKDGKWVRMAPPAEGTAAGEFSIVRRDVDNGNYKTAVKHAKRFQKRYAGDPFSEDVCNLAGKAQMERGRYWAAYDWFEQQLVAYPQGRLADRAMASEIEIAEAFLSGRKRRAGKIFRVSARDDGLMILERIAERAPASDRAKTALLTIGDYYFDRGKWIEAAESYDHFLELFGKSPRAYEAALRAAESHYSAYEGPDFDETPLIEAEQRYKSFLTHYPHKAKELNVRDTLRKIRADRAEKQMSIARYYLRANHPKAAAEYFKIILRDFPDTPAANDAAAQLADVDPAAAAAIGPVSPTDPSTPTTQPAGTKTQDPKIIDPRENEK